MVDEYELKYGPVDDRSIFDGEIIVPPHLKNQTINRSTRIHGGLLGSLNRSRTFLNLPTNLNSRESLIHGSVPDLSRSLPNTPNTNHKSQPDFSIEESNEESVKVVSNLKSSFNGRVKQMAAGSSKNLRRGSDDLPPTGQRRNNVIGISGKMSTANHHNRNYSEPNNKYVPVRTQIKKPTTIFEGISNRSSQNYDKTKRLSASLHNIHKLNQTEKQQQEKITSPSKWGDIRGSNAYSEGFSVGSLSTYTIPRASLNNQRINLQGASTSVDILNDDVGVDDSAA